MKFLVLILVAAPIYVTGEVLGDLLGQEFQYATIDHVRAKRQSHANYQPLSQAPAHIQQLLQSQNARPPLVNIPPQPIPKLGPAQPSKPQLLSQQQVSQYRPQVVYSSGAQQPNYKSIPASPQYKKPIIPQQPQYRPIPAPPLPQYPKQPQYPQQPQYSQQPQYPQQAQQPQQPHYSPNLPPQLRQLLKFQQTQV